MIDLPPSVLNAPPPCLARLLFDVLGGKRQRSRWKRSGGPLPKHGLISSSAGHDALKTLADFRDHLARHDKPIAFFFGAGTSCAVRVPSPADASELEPLMTAVGGLTAMAKKDAGELGAPFGKAWTAIEEQCRACAQAPNAENILSRACMMLSAIAKRRAGS